jgi:hypothetical protein
VRSGSDENFNLLQETEPQIKNSDKLSKVSLIGKKYIKAIRFIFRFGGLPLCKVELDGLVLSGLKYWNNLYLMIL